MFNILVVEDDKNLRKLIVTCLKRDNYTPFEATNGNEALDILDTNFIDLIITDIMMPEMDGFELTRELREAKYQIPILMITAKSDFDDKKMGFELGADDYMVKPLNIEELSLRIKVLLKRAQNVNERKIKVGKVVMDYDQLSFVRGDKVYKLAQKEFYLLYKLLSSPGMILSRQDIMEEIWGLDNDSDYRTIDVHIKRLREKLKDVTEFEIETVRGAGYRLILNGEN